MCHLEQKRKQENSKLTLATAKTCWQRYQRVLKVVRFCSWLCGCEITKPNYRYNMMTLFVVTIAASFFVCTGYTIYVGAIVNGDWTIILQALCMAGSAVQGLIELASYTTQRDVVLRLLSTLDEHYLANEHKEHVYRSCLVRMADRTERLLQVVTLFYCLAAVLICSYPVTMYILYNRKMLIMQLLLPGIDHTTEAGHCIHLGTHLVSVAVGAFANYAGDLYFFVLSTYVILLKDLLRAKFATMRSQLYDSDRLAQRDVTMNDIICWHQQYTNYCKDVQLLYRHVITVEIATVSMNTSFTLFCMLLGVWPAAPAFLKYCIFLLYTYCGLGTIVEIANDNVCYSLYDDCPWYELSIADQKLLILMIEKSQHPTKLTIGAVVPLNVASALQISKAIYSYIMMMWSVVEI